MGSKIIAIFMTILMLSISLIALLTLNITNLSKSEELNEARFDSSVLTTDGSLDNDNLVVMRGSSIISAIAGMDIIDSRLIKLDESKTIYSRWEDDGSGTLIGENRYRIMLDGNSVSASDLVAKPPKLIDPSKYYSIEYSEDLEYGSEIHINEFNTQEVE